MRYSIRQITKIVNQLLEKFSVNDLPINPRKIALNLGIDVLEKDFSDDVSGALVYNNNVPTILCNVNHSVRRKKFTIAHEIGHYILKHGREGLFLDKKVDFIFRNADSATGDKRQEVEANAFAAALLMPEELVAKELQHYINSDGIDLYEDDDHNNDELPFINELANKFKVSSKAMTFRIANLRLLDNI